VRDHIFVFGSNLAGRHGAGAALTALREYGAIPHIGYGPMGQSFAIPTKNRKLQSLPLHAINGYVNLFLKYARQNPDMPFQVTRIGCGLAGFRDQDIAPFFTTAPDNCLFDKMWEPWLGVKHRYWGMF